MMISRSTAGAGAEVEHILRFRQDWPDAVVVRLEENYRSTAAILEHANRLIAVNTVRHDKVLRPARPGGEQPLILQCKDEIAEAHMVVDDARRQATRPGIDLGDIAILFRTNEQPRAFEAELRRTKTPYVLIGGTSFFDRKEVRDILAYLRLMVITTDETALLRIINTPPRGIGSKTVQTLIEHAVAEGCPAWKIMASPQLFDLLSDRPAQAVTRLANLIRSYHRRCNDRRRESLVAIVNDLIATIGYEAELNRIYSDPSERESRWDAVQEVVNALALTNPRTRTRHSPGSWTISRWPAVKLARTRRASCAPTH